MRLVIAKVLNRLFPKACGRGLGAWAAGVMRFRNIDWNCRDWETNPGGVCWCCKLKNGRLHP